MNYETVFVILKRSAIGYGFLLTLATGGLAFANIFGFAATAIQFGGASVSETTPIKTLMNIGWVFGVCVALIGAVAQWRKRRSKQATDEAPRETVQERDQSSSDGSRHGLFASAAWGGFFGALLGSALGSRSSCCGFRFCTARFLLKTGCHP